LSDNYKQQNDQQRLTRKTPCISNRSLFGIGDINAASAATRRCAINALAAAQLLSSMHLGSNSATCD